MSSTAVNSAPAVSTIPTWIVMLLSFLPLQPFHRKSSLLYDDLNISQWSVVKGLSEALSAITCPLLVVEPKCQWWLMRNWAAITWIFFSFLFFWSVIAGFGRCWAAEDGKQGDEMRIWEMPVSNVGAWVIVTVFTVLYPMALRESEATASEEWVLILVL